MNHMQEVDAPPAGRDNYRRAMSDPFENPDIPTGAIVTHPHTRGDEAFSREMRHAEMLDNVHEISEADLMGLARHQPLTDERDIRSYPGVSAPKITMPGTNSDRAAERAADEASDSQWQRFGRSPEEDTGPQRKRRGIGRRVLNSMRF